MAINALKKFFQGDQPLAASAIAKKELKYGSYKYSFLGTASAANGASAASTTYIITVTSGAQILGHYITKNTCASTASVSKVPILTPGTNSIKVSLSQLIFGSDVCEGVVITIEP